MNGTTRVGLLSARLRNLLHSLVLIGGMLVVLCLLGSLFVELRGLLILGALGLLMMVLGPRLSPALILRMYRARPVDDVDAPFLVGVVDALARRARLPSPPQVFYVPSRMVNAFAVGSRGRACIGVTDGILRALSRRELVGVLAHEISHIRSNDIFVMSVADQVTRATHLLSFLGQFLLLVNLPLLLMGGATIPWRAILLLILAPTFSAVLQLALSRTREYDADLGAVDLTGDPRGLASALAKLEQLNAGLFERILLPGRRIPDPSLLRTHPPTEERIRRLLELEGEPRPWQPTPELDTLALPPGVVRVPRWHLSGLWY